MTLFLLLRVIIAPLTLAILNASYSKPFSLLLVGDHLADRVHVGLVRIGAGAEAARTLGVLLGEDVALKGAGALDLPALAQIESLFGSAVSLHLRHN